MSNHEQGRNRSDRARVRLLLASGLALIGVALIAWTVQVANRADESADRVTATRANYVPGSVVGKGRNGDGPRLPTPSLGVGDSNLPVGSVPHGLVVDGAGIPIPGAQVAVIDGTSAEAELMESLVGAGKVCQSNERGEWSLPQQQSVTIENHVFAVRHPEYETAVLPVERSIKFPLRLTMSRGLSISGRVVLPAQDNAKPKPIRGARVVARGAASRDSHLSQDVFPPARAILQSCITDESGRFKLLGLPQGSYSIELVDPALVQGMVMMPGGGFARLQPHLVSEAGQRDLLIRAVPVVGMGFNAVDAATGYLLPHYRVDVRPPKGWIAWKQIGGRDETIRVGGEVHQFGRRHLGAGEARFVWVPDRWPLGTEDLTCRIMHRGYESLELKAPLVPLGDLAKSIVRAPLKSSDGLHGGIAFRLRQNGGQPAGGFACSISFADTDGNLVAIVPRFSRSGTSAPIAMPSGRYSLVSDWLRAARPYLDVLSGAVSTLDITLGSTCVVVLKVRDAKTGSSLDGVGIRNSAGHEPVRVRHSRTKSGGLRTSGGWIRKPGLCSDADFVRIGFDPGARTFEFHRHGYESVRKFVDLQPGCVNEIVVNMHRDDSGRWISTALGAANSRRDAFRTNK